METSPFAPDIIFHLGPVPIDRAVLTTWAIMAVFWLILVFGLRKTRVNAGSVQTALEILVDTIATQLREILRRDPWPYLPLLGTLFVFLALANLAAIVPGAKPPTGHLETPVALGAIVFFSVHFYGIRERGLAGYLRHYVRPNVFMLPLNILSELTRTFSLMIRLFGNMMSHEFVIAIVVYLAGLFVPIPFLLLGIMIGLIQAYIFTILAAVYIGAAVGSIET